MRSSMVLGCGLVWGVAAWAQGEQVDLRAYAPASLQTALDGAPRSRDAAYELDAADRRLRVEATWTGNARKPVAELVPLLTAWMQRRQQKPEPGPTVDPLRLERFAELELEDAGQRHWLLLGFPAITTMSDVKPGHRQAVLVHRIGFAHGRPVAVIYAITTPERMRAALAAPPAAPRPAPAARPQPLASGRYGKGEVRFVYAGKPYALATSTLKDEKTGSPRPHPSTFERHRDSAGGTFEAVSLDFGHPGPIEATLSFHARGPGEYPAPDLAGLDFNFLSGGVFLHLGAHDFPGCTLKIAQIDAARIAGRVECPQPPASGVSHLEFAVAP